MKDQQASAIARMMDAVNAGDAERYARLYMHDAVITIHGSAELRGRGAIEQHEVDLLREFPSARLAFYDMWQKGPLAVVHYAVNCPTRSGQAVGHEGLLFYRFHRSGLIEEERRYLDSLTPLAQMGMLGAVPARALPVLASELRTHVAGDSRVEGANVATVMAGFAALDSRAEAAFLATLAENVVLDDLVYPQPFVGQQLVKTWFRTWTGAVPDAKSEITSILGVGESVLVETVVRGTLKGELLWLRPAKEAFAVHRAAIVQVRAGKFTHVSLFMNSKELAQAVGQWPPRAGN